MTHNDVNQPATADQDWFGGRRWTGIAAIGFIILIALCVVVVVIINHGNGHQNAAPAPAVRASSSLTPTANPTSSPLPTTPPTTAPAGTVWTIYQTLALPSQSGIGPAKVTGSIAIGYQHSPIGALLAVTNEGLRYELAPDAEWRQAAAAMLAPGVGTNAWITIRAKNPYGAAGAAGSNTLLQIAGFQFVSYTPTDAVIQIVNGNPTDGYQVASQHMTWLNDDWKFVPAADGSQASNQQQIDSLSGFIPWRGV